ncbi:hypothetical protein [Halobellus clavatus]|uniref:Uncharacterized protein n=1 Tax=Halobellus clavatus TaxID=660517 RepID=A0A1H3DI55_9EURY|nr:hypothetical protein [Halobellus clavatus]SDX66182.1 hypothetical protein SAMN04487946_101596 [Halobellus clavatus]
MTEDEVHPMTRFLHEAGNGTVAYNTASDQDSGRHWIFNWENDGFNFNFVVQDQDDVLGYEVYAKDIQWIGRFLYEREIRYVEELCDEVRELISEYVEIREEPSNFEEVRLYCSSCRTDHEMDVRAKMELMIEGEPGQQVFEESCPTCGEKLVEKVCVNG